MNGQTIWFAGRWERIKNLLPGRAGIPWRDLPERFGDWKIFIVAIADGLKVVFGKTYSGV